MRKFVAAVSMSLMALPAFAGDAIVKVKSGSDVAATMDALEAAVTGGAAKVDLELADSQLLIFGNPKLGTPAMQDDALAGLYLPLKVLVYQDGDGQTWLAYEDPKEMLGGLGVPADAEYLKKMTGALGKLTGKAAGN